MSRTTNDYALARVRPEQISRHRIAISLSASSDRPRVLLTAFHGSNDYTLHVLNLGVARSIEIASLPDANRRVIETTEDAQYAAHGVTLDLPSRSPVTLTEQSITSP